MFPGDLFESTCSMRARHPCSWEAMAGHPCFLGSYCCKKGLRCTALDGFWIAHDYRKSLVDSTAHVTCIQQS
jgi:hypothetical protein